LREWLAFPPQQQPIRNELQLKLFLGRSAPPGALLEHIQRFRTEQEELLAMFHIIRDSVRVEHAESPNLKYWMLGLSHGMRIRQAEIDWCNEAIRVLESRSADRNRVSRK
jgi:PadR family transcriptional regulator, regulatory protein AphA